MRLRVNLDSIFTLSVCCFSSMIYAATDSTSTVLARTLSILAEHPDAQDKLRQEVTEARKGNNDLDYDDLTSLPYLDAICRETLRL
jgi:cytochrome P450